MSAVASSAQSAGHDRFFVWAASFCLILVAISFAPSYWLQVPAGTVIGEPGLHLHALLFACWPILFILQAWLGATGRIRHHRAWGLAGIALATAMVYSGINGTWREMLHSYNEGFDIAIDFAFGPFLWIMLFAGFFAAAIANTSQRETHKRFMLLSMLALMPPTVGHVMFSLVVGDRPGIRPGLADPAEIEALAAFALMSDLLLIAPIVYDWRTRGRPHRVYIIGGAVMVLAHIAVVRLSSTGVWRAFAAAMGGIE